MTSEWRRRSAVVYSRAQKAAHWHRRIASIMSLPMADGERTPQKCTALLPSTSICCAGEQARPDRRRSCRRPHEDVRVILIMQMGWTGIHQDCWHNHCARAADGCIRACSKRVMLAWKRILSTSRGPTTKRAMQPAVAPATASSTARFRTRRRFFSVMQGARGAAPSRARADAPLALTWGSGAM